MIFNSLGLQVKVNGFSIDTVTTIPGGYEYRIMRSSQNGSGTISCKNSVNDDFSERTEITNNLF